ncbi:MAG: leucine-rich repeat domain-containing protein, partial [Candidatus Poribacteria bacterium]|nr:leucine-rich repeat domain-containing protein [Candidatus Poribacteria bacterium]
MNFCSVTVRDWKTNIKIVIGTLNLFAMIFILPMPVAALEKALVRTRDGSVYQIRFRNINPNSVYNVSNFVDDFSIYDKAGVRELCPGNDESVTWELYTAARVLAKTPRHTSLFDTSALADAVMKTAEEFGIDQQGNVDIIGIVGEIVREMVVDEIKGEVLTLIGPSLNLGIVTINLGTFKIELNASGPPIIVKPTEFLSKLVGIEIEMRRALYAFSRAAAYANTATHLQTFANHKAAALWDVINAGGVVDITGNAFSIQKESVEVSDAIGVFDPLRLRLAAQVYQIYAEYTGEVGTGLAKHEDPIEALLETLASRFSVDIMTEFLSTLSTATDALEKKTALDQLDARLADNIESELHRNINGIYDSAAHDLTSHGFCLPEQNSAVEPADTIPDDMPVVTPISEPNQSPEVSSRINPLNFKVGDGPKCRNLSNYFSDPDGDILIYTSNSSNDHIIVAIIEDNSVKITPVSVGEAKVTVTASDPGGLTETQDFRVTVQAQLETIPSLPVCDRTPQVREEIMKKTGDNNCANVTEDELESIRRLSLLEKDINTLKQGDFDELRGLEKLVLKGNSLETLPEDVFWYLGNLKELSLRNNQFTILVEDSFEHLDSLTYLSLRGNRLTTLQQGAFNDLDTLIELNLSDNQLTTLPAGVFEELFNLNKLTLENNRITILSRDVFLGLSRLTDLELDGNPLQTIEAGAFNGLSSLTKLDFNNYPLQTIEAGAFNGLSSLTK